MQKHAGLLYEGDFVKTIMLWTNMMIAASIARS